MTQEVYNEGRVVGISSYEEYIRQLKSVDPNFDAATEKEWLAASLASGSSMILKIPAGTGKGSTGPYVFEKSFPLNTRLCAGNNIVASYFYGDCECDSLGWATCVKNYGPLISNKSSSSPATNTSTASSYPKGNFQELKLDKSYPVKEPTSSAEQKRMMQYLKIVDGIVMQPGTWKTSGKSEPYKKFEPSLKKPPTIRITLLEEITSDFYILLVGFTDRSVLRALSKFEVATVDTDNPQNGDFLGPECYPWTAKVSFISSPVIDYFLKNSIRRGSRNVKIESSHDFPFTKITSNNLLDTSVRSKSKPSITEQTNTKNTNLNFTRKTYTDPTKSQGSSYWKNGNRNVITQCSDGSMEASGSESITINDGTSYGFVVSNKYKSDDTTIGNGQHGGWYDINIDPYMMIDDFIDYVYDRFAKVDDEIANIREELAKETDERIKEDNRLWSGLADLANRIANAIRKIVSNEDGSPIKTLVDAINKVFGKIYNGSTVKISGGSPTISSETIDVGNLGTSSKPTSISIPKISYNDPYTSNPPDKNIPTGNINVYSGGSTASGSSGWIKVNNGLNKNDLWCK